MPELPEVETMVRGIRPFAEGRRLDTVQSCRCRCRPILVQPRMQHMTRRVRGAEFRRVWRRAKRVVMELSTGDAFVIEPRMTGLMLVADPPDRTHLRVAWQFADDGLPLWFWDRRGLGTVRLYTSGELDQALGDDVLGPDALEMTPEDWQQRFSRSRRAVKVALLDQKLVAGIGNLYASEILHLAGIHPETPCNQLARARLQRLHAAVSGVLEEAIRHEGSTLGDGTYRNALNQSGRYQNAHRVYARAEEACPTCGRGRIERIVQAQRSTFFCPRCQK